MKRMYVHRRPDNGVETIGDAMIDDDGKILMVFHTLEPPDKQNKNFVSCILKGEYDVIKDKSPKFGWCFLILDVMGRDHVLIHWGNFYFDTEACIIVGDGLGDINADGQTDVKNSRKTFKKLFKLMPDKFKLIIT